jgi:hypothetical protein
MPVHSMPSLTCNAETETPIDNSGAFCFRRTTHPCAARERALTQITWPQSCF